VQTVRDAAHKCETADHGYRRRLARSPGAADDSHASGLLEYPHYTRPPEFRGWAVPEALLSGDHARITRWRREAALRRTFLRRPDMLLKLALSEEEKLFLSRVAEEEANRRKPQIPNPKPPTPQGD